MPELQVSIVIGAGQRARRAVGQFARCLVEQRLQHTCILPILLDKPQPETPAPAPEGAFHLWLHPPQFDDQAWPHWLPTALIDLPPAQRECTRAWAKAAFHQQADTIQEFLVDRIPRLSALDTVSRLREPRLREPQLRERGYTLAAGTDIDIYILADLTDPLGSSVFIESACLLDLVCRQLGLVPRMAGLLFLPSATSPAPAEEAMAYAALKELEYANTAGMWGEKLGTAGLGTQRTARGSGGLFDMGCYLLDTVNESGYTLKDELQQVEIAAEWLCAMILQGVAATLRRKLDPRYRAAKLGGKSRGYAGVGLTVRYTPTAELADWAAARLAGDVLSRLVDSQPQTEIARHVGALFERLGLSADVLETRLRHQTVPGIEAELAPLLRSTPGNLELRTRQVLRTVRDKYLSQIGEQLDRVLVRSSDEMEDAINFAVRILLEDMPLGGLNAARALLDALRSRIAEQQAAVKVQRQQHSSRLKRAVDTVSTAFYALRTARMRLPPWQVAMIWALSAVAIPLFSGIQIARASFMAAPLASLSTEAILLGGVIVVLGLWAVQMFRQLHRVNRQHAALVRERFTLESAPLISKTMQRLYASAQAHIDMAEKRRAALAEQFACALDGLRADQARHKQALLDQAGSGVRLSLIEGRRAEAFYQQFVLDQGSRRVGQLAAQINALTLGFVERAGQSADRQDGDVPAAEWIRKNMVQATMPLVEQQLARLGGIDLLAEDEAGVDATLAALSRETQPWWNFKPALIRRVKTQRASLFCGAAERTPRGVTAMPGAEPHALLALTVHYGLPLLALGRIDEYRAHYVEALQHGRLPLHSTSALVLTDDPLTPHRRGQLEPSTLFAAALALGIIRRDAEGHYLVPHSKQSWLRLSEDKSHAVAIMGMHDKACQEVQKRLNARIGEKGKAAIHAILDEYMAVVPDLEDWQVRGIVDLERACGFEFDNDLDV